MDILNITDFFHKNSNKEQEFLNNISNIKNIINKSSIKKYTNINWNIFKHIRLHSKKEYFKINKSQFPIIGYNKTDIVHIILKTNISQLNFWDIMIEILLERFLIFNPCSEDDNIRYIDKHINTYCFILDDNCYLKIKWGWDKSLNNDLKREIYKALEKYYMDNHIYIYYFFNYIKDNSNNVWQKKPEKVMDIILEKIEEYKNIPEYIIDFLKTIRDNILEDDEYDYEILNSFEMFDKKINKKLQSYLKQYLDI
jgi:protoheme ferro-lyase